MPRQKRIQIGLPPELHTKLKAEAKRNKRTLIAEIESIYDYVLSAYIPSNKTSATQERRTP